jgi:hypothetical protein
VFGSSANYGSVVLETVRSKHIVGVIERVTQVFKCGNGFHRWGTSGFEGLFHMVDHKSQIGLGWERPE